MNIILVVDMLKGFLEEGNPLYCGQTARDIIPNIKDLIEAEKNNVINIFVCDSHNPDDLEFKMFPPHCIKKSKEAEIISELDIYTKDIGEWIDDYFWMEIDSYVLEDNSNFNGQHDYLSYMVEKTRYSGFYATKLEKVLKILCKHHRSTIDSVIVVGVCTDICVLHTVADLRNRDYKVQVPRNCVASFNQEAHKWALEHMEKVLGAEIV
jgi:nicotinamidase/pyrazinamidase